MIFLHWSMALRHCSVCGLNYPPYSQPACQVCGGETFWDGEASLHSGWVEDLERAKKAKADGLDPVKIDSERQKVLSWRRQFLAKAGFSDPENIELLAESTADLRRCEDLLHQGCPEHLAAIILS